jgi:hypothetical protein
MINAALCAGGDTAPPYLLSLYWQCERFNSLPEAGGILDQPAGLLQKMSSLANIYDSHKAYYAASNVAKWADANPEAFRVVAMIRRMEQETDGS